MQAAGIFPFNDVNNCSIPPTLDGWVYIAPIHGPLDGPLYTWAQYTPTNSMQQSRFNKANFYTTEYCMKIQWRQQATRTSAHVHL